MFTKVAIQHLRLRFSLLLMPVFLLGVWQVTTQQGFTWPFSVVISERGCFILSLAFLSLHLFIYPGSNAYNSYQDQDEGSIGDLPTPMKADVSVLWISILFTSIGLVISLLAGIYVYPSGYWVFWPFFFIYMLVYVLMSHLYSWRKVRLKRFPITGFLVIFIFQGAWIIYSISSMFQNSCITSFPYLNYVALSASFMFGGGYPITQIYQHKQDKADGVKTISMLLGIKGTLVFSGIMNAIGLCILAYVVMQCQGWLDTLLYLCILAPSFYLFAKWSAQVFKDESKANFENVMRMTWVSAICNNIAIIMLILKPQVIYWLP